MEKKLKTMSDDIKVRFLTREESEERRPGFFDEKPAPEFGEGVVVQGVMFIEPEEDTEEHGIYTVTAIGEVEDE